jgi:hypothetical protein
MAALELDGHGIPPDLLCPDVWARLTLSQVELGLFSISAPRRDASAKNIAPQQHCGTEVVWLERIYTSLQK